MDTPEVNVVEKLRDEAVDRLEYLISQDPGFGFLTSQATNLVLGYDRPLGRDEDDIYWSTLSTVIAQALSLASVRQQYLRTPVK